MPIRTKCPSCQTAVSVPDSAAGKSARCQSCQQIFKIPSPSGAQTASSQATSSQKKPAAPAGRVIKCPGCQSAMRIPAASQGKVLACPRCQKKFRVPGAPATAAPTIKPSAPVRPKPSAPAPMPPSSSNLGSGGLDDFDFADLGTAPPAGPNPYVPPSSGFGAANAYAPSGQYAASARPANRSEILYVIPGIFILIWSILVIGSGLYRLGDMAYVLATREMPLPQGAMPRVVGFVVGAFLALIVGIVMAIGAFNMVRRTGLSSARTTAIMAIIPCFGGCVFPIGIWATVLLFTGSVKKDFYD